MLNFQWPVWDSESDNTKFCTSGPVFIKILMLRVAPSNKILRKFVEMWVFPLKNKEKIIVKKKFNPKAFQPLKEVLRIKIDGSMNEDF